jgi:dynein heavy chain
MLKFILTGGMVLEEHNPVVPCNWLLHKQWTEMCRASNTLPKFAGFHEWFIDNHELFQDMYASSDPQDCPIPGEWQDKCDPLMILLVMRLIRPDKMVPAMIKYIISTMGEKFTLPPPFDLQASYNDSTVKTPLIFVLSPGSDPFNDFAKLADNMNKS